ncbi:Uncharacterised protein [Mycobacteroides abscessus subsp. abscessus]|nr:Uncharacterised protein [Mycobacteroides abscessus subsp. abscessus]
MLSPLSFRVNETHSPRPLPPVMPTWFPFAPAVVSHHRQRVPVAMA